VPPQPRVASQHTLVSFYGRLNYTLLDRYLFTATIRWDGSSRFAPAYRWGTFPAVAFAWRINQESFMKENLTFSDLKLRLSYGITGQQDIPSSVPNPNYPYLPAYLLSTSGARYPFGDSSYYTYRPYAYAANIRWEQTSA
jgi:TonB-dependent starch-binding outer membrane protein SusC